MTKRKLFRNMCKAGILPLSLAVTQANAQEPSVKGMLERLKEYVTENFEQVSEINEGRGPFKSYSIKIGETRIEVSDRFMIIETPRSGKVWRFYDIEDQSTLDRLIITEGSVSDRENMFLHDEGRNGIFSPELNYGMSRRSSRSEPYKTRRIIDLVESRAYSFGDSTSSTDIDDRIKEGMQGIYESVIRDIANKILKEK